MNKLYRFLDFLRFVLKRFNEVRGMQIASSLTYTTLLSLVPLVTIMLTMIAAFPVFSDLTTELKLFILSNLVPDSAGVVITVYMQQFSENAAKLTAMGVIFLAVTAFMLMLTIEQAFNTIWRVARQRSMLNRVLIYWAVLTLGPLLIGGSISLTSYLLSFSLGFVTHIPAIGLVMLKVMPVVLTSAAFALLYMTVPNRFVPWSHAVVGAIVAGLAFELMKQFFAFYISSFGSYKLVYGAFASFPIFLLWVYVSWVVVLMGAVIAASLSYWRGSAWQIERVPGRQFYDALHVIRLLYLAHQKGEPVTLQQLRQQVQLGFDELEEILERLSEFKWARRFAGNSWALVIDPQKIQVSEIYRLFVFRPTQSAQDSGAQADEVSEFSRVISERLEGEMGMSVKELFTAGSEEARAKAALAQ